METKAHTVKRFDAELEELNNNVVKMASAVEEQLGRLGDALVNLNADEAAKVMAEDHVINSWEAELDDYLETIISRRQPQAVDLRLLLGYYRMTTDFERMGDEIRNAAKGVRKLSELVKPLSEPALANVSTLFSLHALLRVMGDDKIACVRLLDPERARALVARRTIVSAEVDEALSDTVERLKTGELKLADGLEFIRINRSLERVAAHMQNVGETVVFMTEGVDIRHAGKTQPQQTENISKCPKPLGRKFRQCSAPMQKMHAEQVADSHGKYNLTHHKLVGILHQTCPRRCCLSLRTSSLFRSSSFLSAKPKAFARHVQGALPRLARRSPPSVPI